MMKLKMTAVLIALTALSACGRPDPEPAPQPVMPEPVYDKYGNQVG